VIQVTMPPRSEIVYFVSVFTIVYQLFISTGYFASQQMRVSFGVSIFLQN